MAKLLGKRLPLLVLIAGLLLSALLWWALATNQRRQREQVAAIETQAIERTLRAGLDERARALARAARRWQGAGGQDPAGFELEASVLTESYPALRSIGWVGPDLVVRRVHPQRGNEAALGFDNRREPRRRAALEVAVRAGEIAVAGPLPLMQGGRGLLLFQPIGPVAGRPQGFIYAAVDPRIMLDRIVGDLAPTDALEVAVGGSRVYERAGQGDLTPADAPPHIATFRFGGRPWTLSVRMPQAAPGLAQVAPIIAALLSVALALVIRRSQAHHAHDRAMQRELRAGEERFRATFEQAAVGIGHVAADGRWLRVNDRLCDITGYTREELLARTERDVTHPDDLDNDAAELRRLVAGEIDSCSYEKRYVRKDGSVAWIALTVSAAREGDGRPAYQIAVIQDIGARKAAEERLRASEEDLRYATELNPQVPWTADPAGNITGFSDRWLALTGMTREHTLGAGWMEAPHPDDRAAIIEAWERSIASGEPYDVEHRIRLADRSYRWMRSRARPRRDEGRIVKWYGTTEDIHDRKLAEEALRESEQRLRATFEQAAVGIAEVGVSGRWLRVNERLCDMLGYTREELAALTFQDVTHPDDLDSDLDLFRKLLAGEIDTYSLEKRYFRKDGHLIWINLTVALVRHANGEPAYEISVIEDISERKAAENRLRLAAEVAGFGTFDYDVPAERHLWSPETYRIYGLEPGDLLTSRTIDALIHPDDRVRAHAYLDAVLARGETDTRIEYRIVRPGGDVRHVSARSRIEYAANGAPRRPLRIVGAVQDITEQREAETEIRTLNATLERRVEERTRELAEANDALNGYAYMISHDLRAPLRAMEGFARILLEDYAGGFDAEGQRYATRIVEAATRMESLIEDLLAYSRLSRAEIDPRPVALDRIVHHCIAEVRNGADAPPSIEAAPDLPVVLGEPAVVSQILCNLLGNAVKFHKPGERPHVRVRAEDRGAAVRLWVEDDGIGIAPEHQARIFDVFERLHGQEAYPGTGVGLAIVRKGVERLGGACGVESAPGQGSRFWIELGKAGTRDG